VSQEERVFKQTDQYQHKKKAHNLTGCIRLEISLSVLVSTTHLLRKDKTSIETGHQVQGTHAQSMKALRRTSISYFCRNERYHLKHV